MRHFFHFFIISLMMTGVTQARTAQVATTSSAIMAVVNDEAITSYDMDARIKFVLATTRIPSTKDAIAKLRPQILRILIDERLQLQEGRRNNITLVEQEVEQAIAAIEHQRDMAPGSIRKMLAANRIPEETFLSQVKAQIVWGKLLQRQIRSRIKITDEEVADMSRRLSRPVIKQEMKIALLQLPVDSPKQDREVLRAAEKMVLEVRGGADFEELARQFAGGAAREVGKLPTFWVRPDELDPVVAKTLEGAKAGDVSNPLKNQVGYTIIKVYDTRDLPGQKPTGTEITFKEILLNLRSSMNEEDMGKLEELAKDVAAHPGSCADEGIGEVDNTSLASIEVKQTKQMLANLPAALRVVADGMKIGEVSMPLASDDGIHLYMLCGRREDVAVIVDEERARSAAYQQRMELEAQKYMRNLRRDGFIEIRG